MSTAYVIYELARADFFERVRRFSFAVTMVLTVFAAYIFVPPDHASYTTLNIGGHRGIYNSAWVGAQVALLTASFLVIIGFYLVRNAINRDRVTGVGLIIAGTPVSRPVYTLGKWLSNCAVLGLIGAITAIGAGVLQLIRGEDMVLRPLLLIAPFVYLLIPTVALISAIAVLFESIPFLSRGFGNIAYFFVFPQLMVPEMLGGPKILGISYLLRDMQTACRAVYPDYVDAVNLGINFHEGRLLKSTTFVWNGMPLTAGFLGNRLFWTLVAVGIAMIAAIPFDRFDEARRRSMSSIRERRARFIRVRRWLIGGAARTVDHVGRPSHETISSQTVHLTPLISGRSSAGYLNILMANLYLALKGMRWWWHLGALGLIICEAVVPQAGVRAFVLPAALIWPTMIWSSLGNREISYATHPIVFSTAHPLRRQLSAAWLAGVMVTLMVVSGAGIRWVVMGDWPRAVALLVGATFIPSLALALGTWSRSSRLFEVIYLFWWYVGPTNSVDLLDYAGASEPVRAPLITAVYAAAAVLLLILGFLGGRRQMAS